MADITCPQLVLDSWPLVEWLKGHQPAKDKLTDLLVDAVRAKHSLLMSRINLGEVIYIGRKEIGMSESDVGQMLQTFQDVPIEVVSATDARVDKAVDIKSRYNVSYADAFAVGLSIELDVPIVTGDREFRVLESEGLLRVHWLGA